MKIAAVPGLLQSLAPRQFLDSGRAYTERQPYMQKPIFRCFAILFIKNAQFMQKK